MKVDEVPVGWLSQAALIVDRNQLERFESGGIAEIDAFVRKEIQSLRREYFRMGNPRPVYLTGMAVSQTIRQFPGHLHSFQFAQLESLLAELLLAHGTNSRQIIIVLSHLEKAFDILDGINVTNASVIQAYVFNSLLLCVTKKALGNIDDSINDTRTLTDYLRTRKAATELDVIPLRRQEIIMRQTIEGHRKLADAAAGYKRLRPKEYYRTLKRVFEFLLNMRRTAEAERIVPELKRAFAVISRQVAPISHISFQKNIGQYLMTRGDIEGASAVLARVLGEANSLNLQGQIRQVRTLLQHIDAGQRYGKLVTFQVHSG